MGEKSQAEILTEMQNAAMKAFQQGNWGPAASGFEKLIREAPNAMQPLLGPIHLTLGAAYYNMPNFPKAIEVFSGFIAKYPNSEQLLDAKLALGQTYMASKNFDEAIKLFASLENLPAVRERALMAQAVAFKLQKKIEKAIPVLEKLVGADIKSTAQANGAVMLVELYVEKNETAKAAVLLERLQARIAIMDNLVTLNTVALKLADGFADKKMFGEAIGCYRLVRPRDEVIAFQTDRIAKIEKLIAFNAKVGPENPMLQLKAQQQNNVLKPAVEDSKALLAEFVKLPDYASSLMFRVARCWYDWDKKWEALVVYKRLLDRFPKSDEREPAMFDTVVTLADLNRIKSTQAACDAYLKEFPNGENAGTVGYMSGAVALQAGDYADAEAKFATMIEKQPKSTYRGTMLYLLGNAKFAQGRYEDANAEYEKYLQAFPEGTTEGSGGLFGIGANHAEECTFRIAVSHVFLGKYEEGLKLLNAYAEKYPKGFFLPDTKYRIAICYYAASQFEDVVSQCEAWTKEFPDDQMDGEVQALYGDALAALGRRELAIPAYVRSYKKAGTDEVLNYSLFEASKHMQKLGRWDDVGKLFTEFVAEKPDHPAVVAAMYWIAKAKAKEGRGDEAKVLLVENLQKYIAEPKREAVEQLLTQLAQLCSKRVRSGAAAPAVESPPGAPPGEATAGEAPAGLPAGEAPAPLPPYDPFAELEKQLQPIDATATPAIKARLMFAQAEMATIKKQDALREKILREMSDRFKPEDLSPVLLALIGDFLLEHGEPDRATKLYEVMRENYPKSDHLDIAYVGLGEIAFAKKDYDKALKLFTEALDGVTASMKMKEATIGKAKTLLELGKFAEAKKLFEQVASIKEWRGDATALAVFSLGEIEARQNKLPEAIAFYRRVFVAYQKYLPWVAKSYLRAADTFEKMGKRNDAIENLRDMLRNEKLRALPETQQARKRLEEWGVAQG